MLNKNYFSSWSNTYRAVAFFLIVLFKIDIAFADDGWAMINNTQASEALPYALLSQSVYSDAVSVADWIRVDVNEGIEAKVCLKIPRKALGTDSIFKTPKRNQKMT
ncbi:hypothetical protein [Thiothrix fructosivorans]|uniref:Uncharacterized protein n=1 Tax=Thiothrix fructosivorans TaxID=111770 RepID=A0A8B0SJE0_9GAMM|nr:hypothetical protein [Thiothrix fructosivorans]MBO0613828.1 hypothetical protein [Thiothrix fructosivorans]QTX10198.1 hypothetical protein J1836_016645 [Thiothrix fructosivorans]